MPKGVRGGTKGKGSRPAQKKTFYPHATEEANEAYIRFSMHLATLAESGIDITDYAAVKERINAFFDICIQDGQKPGVAGLALALGTVRRNFIRWVHGDVKYIPSDVVNLMRMARSMLDAQTEAYILNGEVHPVSAIFYMKNSLDYEDVQRHQQIPADQLNPGQNEEDLRQKYLEASQSMLVDSIVPEKETDLVTVED